MEFTTQKRNTMVIAKQNDIEYNKWEKSRISEKL